VQAACQRLPGQAGAERLGRSGIGGCRRARLSARNLHERGEAAARQQTMLAPRNRAGKDEQMQTMTIRGVPLAMQQDGWWLDAPPASPRDGGDRAGGAPLPWRATLLLALIALGDVLVWQVVPGLSLAVFGGACVLAALLIAAPRVSPRRAALVAGGGLLALLPLVELVQPLSVMLAVLGVSAMLCLLAGVSLQDLPRALPRLWPAGAAQTARDAGRATHLPKGGDIPRIAQRLALGWLMPLALGLVFAALLIEANPVVSRWVDSGLRWQPDLPDGARLAFWLVLVPMVWTCLSLPALRDRLLPSPRARACGPPRQGLVNPASVTRALVLFNAGFALQTGMDAVFLYGGVGLPEGITHAEYAHRGAYPLVVTALLAGGFALVSRPFTQGSALLRGLLMLWVAQNLALVVSSLVRLDLYVDVYGLTRLRMAAAIWMGLTAAGLALVLWQVWRRQGNGWLMLRAGGLGSAVLYACCFVSFDAAIARYNLGRPMAQDLEYVCSLGDAAQPLIAAWERRLGLPICERPPHVRAPRDWREWGFRNARARHSLSRVMAEEPAR
jgi:hypothetical protein